MDKSGYFLSGHPALRAIGIGSFGGPGEPGATQGIEPRDVKMMFVTVLGGKGYSVGYAALPENFPNLLQTAQTMIDSFQIISDEHITDVIAAINPLGRKNVRDSIPFTLFVEISQS
jgi:hypothetical protein